MMNFNRFNEGRDLRFPSSSDDIMQQIDYETKKDMVYDYVNNYFECYDTLPNIDNVTEAHEHIYLDSTLVKEVLKLW